MDFTHYLLRFYSLPIAFLLVTRFLLPVAFGNGKSNLNAEFLPLGVSVVIHHNVEAGSNIARKNSSSQKSGSMPAAGGGGTA